MNDNKLRPEVNSIEEIAISADALEAQKNLTLMKRATIGSAMASLAIVELIAAKYNFTLPDRLGLGVLALSGGAAIGMGNVVSAMNNG